MLVSTTLTQVRFGAGAWRDAGRVTNGLPFAVALENGEEIEVDPRDAVVEGGSSDVQAGPFSRDIVFRISAGDAIWATGILSRPEEHRAGAYRSGATRRRLTAPRRGRVTLSRESPVPRWQALAAAHKKGAYLAAGVGAVVHGLVFRKVDAAVVIRDQAAFLEHLTGERFAGAAFTAALLALLIAGAGWRRYVADARGPSWR